MRRAEAIASGRRALERAIASDTGFRVGLALSLCVAVAVRTAWVAFVQDPGDAIVSDMAGYLQRAADLAAGTQSGEEYLAAYPFGTHYLYALEMKLFGATGYTAMAAVQIALGAAVAPLGMLVARNALRSPFGPYAVGAILSVWQPHVSYSGYFTSEVPFSFFLCLGLWLSVRLAQSGRGALATGAAFAVGYALRPQLLLTALGFGTWLAVRGRRLHPVRGRSLLLFALPVVLAVGYGALRYHHYTGRTGLISDNGHVMQLFAGTEYRRVVVQRRDREGAPILDADGEPAVKVWSPPATRDLGYTRVFEFSGYSADPAVLDAERRRVRSGMSWREKLGLLRRNVVLLAYNNEMWPERHRAEFGARNTLLELFAGLAGFYLVPFAVIGLLTLITQRNPTLEILGLHVLTMLCAAALYFGEIRYRVPYDSVLVILAVRGVFGLVGLEPRGEPQERWVGRAVGCSAAAFALLVLPPWGLLSKL